VTGLLEQISGAARAGVQLIQLRERDLAGRELADLTRQAIAAVHGTPARVLVNDRLDVALAARAAGVHLRSTSFPPSCVRRIAPRGFLVGCSIHSAAEAVARAAEGADYLVFGPVFDTPSKPGIAGTGLDALADVVRATSVPVLALGGLTRIRIPEVLAMGAAGFAGISMFAEGSSW
jgi:thiamine-phosphate pyrophosphorylase